MFKPNQTTEADFNFTEMDIVFRALGGFVEEPMAVDESSQAAA